MFIFLLLINKNDINNYIIILIIWLNYWNNSKFFLNMSLLKQSIQISINIIYEDL